MVPITAATIAVNGKPSGVCTAANVTTAVIVPGPAANMISGASDFWMLIRRHSRWGLTDRIAAPQHIDLIYAMIMPPTIRNTSNEMLKMLKTLRSDKRGSHQNNENAALLL